MSRREVLRAAALTAAGGAALPVLSACGSRSTPKAGTGASIAISSISRKAADRAALQPGARVVQSFGTDLLRAMATGDGNVACSPYSVSVALAMTRNGARGATASEMDHVLHASSAAELNAGLNALTAHLDGLKKVTLDTANSLWGQRGVRWQRPFLDALAQSYGTGMRQVDYERATEGARRSINGWTSDQTHDRIPQLIPAGILDQTTRLVLVNAIYLKAPWAAPFLPGVTERAAFTKADGTRVSVAMMRADTDERLAYARGAGWQAVDLPYAGGGLAMAVVVPDAGSLASVVAGFDGEFWRGLLTGLEHASVALRLPRWKFRTQILLNDLLAGLGMPTAFSDRADFSGMAVTDALAIGAVVHEAFVAVDEKGTEAAAATAVEMRTTGAMQPDVDLTVDRPFLFVLHDTATGTPLFIGQVADPSAAR
jgi:serine protease inhibitor